MAEKREQISIKLSEQTKSDLDKMKKFDKQTYDEIVAGLIIDNKNCYPVELNNVDADWKERTRKIHKRQASFGSVYRYPQAVVSY